MRMIKVRRKTDHMSFVDHMTVTFEYIEIGRKTFL